MKPVRLCEECHGELPGDTPEGLCPKCLVRFGGAELGIVVRRQPAPLGGHGPGFEPRRFGHYELLERIGQGGMGTVYKARQLNLDRYVALKLLPFGASSGPSVVQRFRTEATAAAALQHPHIVAVHDVGEHEGQPFFTMDYVEGRTLAELVRDQPLPAKRAATYLRTIAEAVHYAHQHGIIHRDLKPSNVLIDAADQPRITDFGLAKRLHGDSDLTLTGQVLGSPNFISPEQAEGRSDAIGPPSDIYSLGALLYHLLTRQPPFQADTLTTLLKQVLEAEPVPPRSLNPSIPKDLETICLKCLEKEGAHRYGTAEALADDLGRFLQGQPVWARPVGTLGKSWRWCRRQPLRAALAVGLGLSVLCGVGGISWQWHRAEKERRLARTNELWALRQAYAADMNLVQRALQDGDLGGARRMLNKYQPQSAVTARTGGFPGPDLRAWEWRYLWGLSRDDGEGVLAQYPGPCVNLALGPGTDLLAVRLEDGTIDLWNLATRQPAGTLTNRGYMLAMAWFADGRLLASGNQDAEGNPVISIWDVGQKRIIRNLLQPSPVIALAVSTDSKRIATFNTDPRLRTWDAQTGEKTLELPASEWVNTAGRIPLFSPDGDILASGEMDGRIRLISSRSGSIRELPAPGSGDCISAVAFSPDGQLLAAGYAPSESAIHLWEVATGNPAGRLEGHRGGVYKLAFSRDGQSLYSASIDQSIRIWDLTRKRPPVRLQGHTAGLWGLVVTRDGQTLASCDNNGSVRLWDARRERPEVWRITLPETAAIFGAAFTPDSRCVISASPTSAVTIWDAVNSTAMERIPALGSNNLSVALSPDQRLLAVGSTNGVLRIWDLKSKTMLKEWQAHSLPVYRVCFVDGGNSLLSVGTIVRQRTEGKRWDVASWRELPCSAWATTPFCGVALSPDQRLLAIPVAGGLGLWNCAADRQEIVLAGGGLGVAAFSSDGRLVAAPSGAGAAVWELGSQRKLAYLEILPANSVSSAAFSPDGTRLATGLASGSDLQPALRIWDYVLGRELLALHVPSPYVASTEFSPDGNTLMALTWSGAVNLYRAPSWAEIAAAERAEATGPVSAVSLSGMPATKALAQTQGERVNSGPWGTVCMSWSQFAPTARSGPALFLPQEPNQLVASDDFDDGKPEGWISRSSGNRGSLLETNGCLTVRGYWPGAFGCTKSWAKGWMRTPAVSLVDGHSLERRVDLVRMSESTTLVNHTLSGDNLAHGYTLIFGPHCVCLAKWMPWFALLSCNQTSLPGSNVVLSLVLTRDRTNLLVTARVLDKANPQRVLFEHTVVDTPAVEKTLTASEANPVMGVSVPDWARDAQGLPWFNFDYADLEIIQENDGSKPEAVAVFDNFELRRYAAKMSKVEKGTR